jgi:beta-N-acetylhexosaminidase
MRNRRIALAAIALLALLAGAALGSSDRDGGALDATIRPQLATVAGAGGELAVRTAERRARDARAEQEGARRAAAEAGEALDDAVGSRIVTRMAGTTPSSRLLRRARRGEIGGVILFADNVRTLDGVRSAVARLQRAARDGGHPPLLVMVDQEGGLVKRFRSLPPTRSALAMGDRSDRTAVARREGRDTGRALRRLGIAVDLAPVVDVPSSRRSFLATRAFGTNVSRVRATACAFADGLAAGGGVPTLKHFPGLGRAGANTDDVAVRITASRSSIEAGLAPYERCGRDGDRLVMVSSAVYPALGGKAPAVLEARTYRLLREDVRSEAITISDDLQTPALDGQRDVEVRAARAGLELLLFAGTEAGSELGYRRLRAAAREKRLPRAGIVAAATRIDALRRSAAAPAR